VSEAYPDPIRPVIPPQNLNENMIVNEDRALKQLLMGMTVSDNRQSNRPVKVFYGQPDVEITDQTYPYITIDLIDADEATERAMRGIIELQYQPEGAPKREDGHGLKTDYPIPYDLVYQITTYARDPRHDRKIMNQIARRLGGRYHSLYVPEDNTERSMFLTNTLKRDLTEANRRLFSNAYTVVVYSELIPADIEKVAQVKKVDLGINGQHETITHS